MSHERGGGETSSIWRMHLSRAQLLATKIETTFISPNPGHEVTETRVVLPSSTLPSGDLRRYELTSEGEFKLQPIVDEE